MHYIQMMKMYGCMDVFMYSCIDMPIYAYPYLLTFSVCMRVSYMQYVCLYDAVQREERRQGMMIMTCLESCLVYVYDAAQREERRCH